MIIAVASAGRAGKVATLHGWPREWIDRTFLVVPDKELREYQNEWPNVIAHPDSLNRLSPKRDWINDHFGDHHVIHADDDSKFFVRNALGTLSRANPRDMATTLGWFQRQLESGIVYVGMGFRFMSHERPDIVEGAPGISNFYGVNTLTLHDWNFRFAEVELLQGLHLAITVAKRGYDSRMLYQTVYEQIKINAPGGCSVYRTGEMYDRAATIFRELHGDYVTIGEREVKWEGMEGLRKMIRVNWKKIREDNPPIKRAE